MVWFPKYNWRQIAHEFKCLPRYWEPNGSNLKIPQIKPKFSKLFEIWNKKTRGSIVLSLKKEYDVKSRAEAQISATATSNSATIVNDK